ncbi:bifunctional non-homologous end joining protein LigD [Nocardioides scoriae]|uniref:Bifunctional non-homologous end joining protein LigD n=1 Tax=Nocardioides scoriae TaxID=642780 RepID=A0A1H1QRJ2_9ACTN|nr:non-homologous end-joining DNA ligase [Nocardioides scoriae]SDS26112.1 bifunctional non-homologous end joining protein LigD [Nocardioides scoriae]
MAAKPERTETRVEVDGHVLTLVNLEKVMYPRTGTTKAEVLHYYAQVAPVMLPHLADRAVTRIRWPHGTGDASFFEKNAPSGTPSWVRTVAVPTTGSRRRASGEEPEETELHFPVVDSLATLTWLVNLAALELHVHQWTVTRTGRPRHPDRLVIDLDPGEPAGLMECAQVALLVRDRLAEEGLRTVPVTSGSKGLHLYAGLDGRRTHEQVRDHAKQVAEELEASHRSLVTSQMTKARRGGKVFLDWSQNTGSKTTIAPYSLRGRDAPTVAAPRTWEEVEAGAEDVLGLEHLRYDEVLARIAEHGDLFDL